MRNPLPARSSHYLIPLLACVLALCPGLFTLSGCNKQKSSGNQTRSEQPGQRTERSGPREVATLADAIVVFEHDPSPDELKKAIDIFRGGAQGNNPEAQYYIGLAHFQGRGADQSRMEAYYWWTVAARNGYVEAMNAIEDLDQVFNTEDQEEIANRANDWFVHVAATPEMNRP